MFVYTLENRCEYVYDVILALSIVAYGFVSDTGASYPNINTWC